MRSAQNLLPVEWEEAAGRKLRNTNICSPEKRKNPVTPSATRQWSQPVTTYRRSIFSLDLVSKKLDCSICSANYILSREWITDCRQLVPSAPGFLRASHHGARISHVGFCGVFNEYWYDVRTLLQHTWVKVSMPYHARFALCSSRAREFPGSRQLQGRDGLLHSAEWEKSLQQGVPRNTPVPERT